MTSPAINSLQWHKENLKNVKIYTEGLYKELLSLQVKIDMAEERSELYERQISAAEKEGKTSFDAERYLKLRKKGN